MKNPAEIRQVVEDLAKPLVAAQNLAIWGLDVIPGPTLRVCLYVDGSAGCGGGAASGEQSEGCGTGATIDQCERISRQLGLALDVEDIIDQPWTLEVSSPGLERKFYTLGQLAAYIGDIVDVRLVRPLGDSKRKAWRGRLEAVHEYSFAIEPCSVSAEGEILSGGGQAVEIPWADVSRAQRVHVFTVPQKPGKKAARKKQG